MNAKRIKQFVCKSWKECRATILFIVLVVMGDNRDRSRDSRFFGFVDRAQIVGKAKGVIGSFDITDKYQPRLKRFFASLK